MWPENRGIKSFDPCKKKFQLSQLWNEVEEGVVMDEKGKKGIEEGKKNTLEVQKRIREEHRERHVSFFYPLWKQIEIIRSGNVSEINKMAKFIENCKQWNQNFEKTLEELHKIDP